LIFALRRSVEGDLWSSNHLARVSTSLLVSHYTSIPPSLSGRHSSFNRIVTGMRLSWRIDKGATAHNI